MNAIATSSANIDLICVNAFRNYRDVMEEMPLLARIRSLYKRLGDKRKNAVHMDKPLTAEDRRRWCHQWNRIGRVNAALREKHAEAILAHYHKNKDRIFPR